MAKSDGQQATARRSSRPTGLLQPVNSDSRPCVAVGMGAFWPGNDASGPNRSLSNLCNSLASEFQFKILARSVPFSGRLRGNAQPQLAGDCEVVYLEPGVCGLKGLIAQIKNYKCDILLLNGFFDRDITIPIIIARRLGLLKGPKILIAPRGEFLAGALSLKATRKKIWTSLVRALGLVKGMSFHATSEEEAHSIRNVFGHDALIRIAPNITARVRSNNIGRADRINELRVGFVGRLTAVKNLDFAIQALRHVRARVHFVVVGPAQDMEYVRQCTEQLQFMPSNITSEFTGEVPASEIESMLATLDLMFLPSKSENFGHAISEALSSGLPCLIGNATPWKNLESTRAGWDLPLSDPRDFAAVIDQFADFDSVEREQWRKGAVRTAIAAHGKSNAVELTRAILNEAIKH